MSLVKQCIFLCTLRSICYVRIKIIIKIIIMCRFCYLCQSLHTYKHITGINNMPYHVRVKSIGRYSLQRRRERYCIIYIWKIIVGLALNFSIPVTSTISGRRDRSCVISQVNVSRVGTLANNCFRLPMHLRSISSCSVLRFKTQLDIFL